MLDPRLSACAAYVRRGAHVCDVGTDHALLPVHLVEQGIVTSAIAADIGEGPLQAAERTIAQHGLTGQITTLLSDGLMHVPESVTDIVIAGMGGETMVHILADAPFSLQGRRLILQPMTKAEVLRSYLYAQGFAIRSERCVRVGRYLYAVLCAELSDVPQAGNCYIGAMDLADPDCLAYAKRQYDKLLKKCTILRSREEADAALEAAVQDLARRLEEHP